MNDKPGRNDPCPCGSGRKHKQCCLRTTRRDPLLPVHETRSKVSGPFQVSYTRFLYPDTNILGIWAEDLASWAPPLTKFMREHDLCIALGDQIAELRDAPRLHENLDLLLTSLVPSVLVKPWFRILYEEIQSYPQRRTNLLVAGYLDEWAGKGELARQLSSDELTEARNQQKKHSELMKDRTEALMPNFPPSPSGEYTEEQADDFAWKRTEQVLKTTNPEFLRQLRKSGSDLKTDSFLSLSIEAYVIFYKYYLYRKTPQRSDFGDLFHLSTLPYCNLAILERDLSNVLNHIKKNNRDILDRLTVTNVDFFKDWKWDEVQNQSQGLDH